MSASDPSDLARFLAAQEATFADALAELREGRKRSHWMWFIFPQLRGLGRSSTAHFYGIASGEEARRYLAHPVLGDRLRRATATALAVKGRSAHAIFGSPDDLKFHSCMTLFAAAGGGAESTFDQALTRFFAGAPDAATLRLLAADGGDGQ